MSDTATAISTRERSEIPDNVPADRVYNVDMYAPDGIEDGYHEAWKRLQGPHIPEMIWTPYTGGHWIVTRGELIREIYLDPARFSSEVIFLPKEAGEKYALVPTRLDPPEHTPYRKVLAKGLNMGQVHRIENLARTVAGDLIDGFAASGECDFPTDYAEIFPVKVFMALAGLPLEDAPKLSRWAQQMTRPDGSSPEEMAACLDEGNQNFFAYVEPLIEARRGNRGEDLISIMVDSDINNEVMAHDMALGLISLLLVGGLDTVVNFLSYMMLYLARNPDKVAQLREEPNRQASGLEELFRRFGVVAEGRMAAKDFEYCGVNLKRGDMILIPTALHGLDETLNPDPWRVDFNRKDISHSLFGGGAHRCAGAHMARMEVMVTLQEWLKRIPEFGLKAGAKPAFHSGIVATVENVPLVWSRKN
jgi:cytochrome P450